MSTIDRATTSCRQGEFSNDESFCLSLGAQINAFEKCEDNS